MTYQPTQKDLNLRRIASALAGLLLALSFPRMEIAGLAWLAPGLLLFSTIGLPGRLAFQIGWIGGFVLSLVSMYWMNYMPVTGLPVLAWMALSAYVAAYYGLWTCLANRLLRLKIEPDSTTSIGTFFTAIAALPLRHRFLWILFCASSWTGLEFIRGWFLTGYPWLQLGATQYKLIPLIQVVSITGIPGLTFILAWFSVSLISAMLTLAHAPNRRHRAWLEILPPLVVIAATFAWGTQRIRPQIASRNPPRSVKLALIQPSVPQTLIWDSKESTNRFNRLLELSRTALAAKPEILIWPEAAVPGLLRYDAQVGRPILELAREHGVWIICGSDDARFPEGAAEGSKPDYYNSAFLINPKGELVTKYDKRRLVIFGEYVPLARWLPFLKWFTPIQGGFQIGREAVQFKMPELKAQASVLICFEDIFAWLARDASQPETDFLINLTNDGWFGESSQHWQHLIFALFRSVETGRPLVRCTNNGISCWIDPTGRIRGLTENKSKSVHAEGFKVISLPLPARDVLWESTPFQKHGDWFAWICVICVGAGMGISHLRDRRA